MGRVRLQARHEGGSIVIQVQDDGGGLDRARIIARARAHGDHRDLESMPDGELSARVARLLERTGFKSRGLFVMDGSKRSSHGNAFFAGLGAGKRIVLFDTLVSRLEPPEVEAVLAHELGHYKLHHIAKALALSAAVSFAGLWVLGQLIDQPWFYQGLGVTTPGTAAALLLFLAARGPGAVSLDHWWFGKKED